jgi:F-box protein 18 (helicase)
MKLTDEQNAIIASTGNIRINAVAGSGKTTTIIEYARTRPKKSKILYLAFNKSVKLEAAKKFEKLGLTNVRVETAHSLAYKYIVFRFNYKVRVAGYRATELVDILKMHRMGERHAEYILANHVLRFAAYYCNSDALKLEELNYRDTLHEAKVKSFVNAHYELLVKYTSEFLRMMNSREIEVTHDYYLKKFQLTCPKMKYDYILFDEGQDASAAMLAVFFNQDSTKVIVGDRHQQIYGWRFAVNSLEKADYATYNLSTSFRFGEDVAKLAMDVLKYKEHLVPASGGSGPSPLDSPSDRVIRAGARDDNALKPHAVSIIGAGSFTQIKSRAILARTNLGLLLKAIAHVTENKNLKKIYFEGNINSYTYAEDGTSLYDVLNLHKDQKYRIKDRLIKSMKDMDDLSQYIEKTGDPQLGMMVEIVEQYGDKIPGILAKIKSLHVENEKREEAELIFSTVHRCKGLEYDEIELVNDFIKEDSIIKQISDAKRKEPLDVAKITEEINLLYVAATRARVKIVVEEEMLPKEFVATENIGPPREPESLSDRAPARMTRSDGESGTDGRNSTRHLSASTTLSMTSSAYNNLMGEDEDDIFEREMEEREERRYMEKRYGHAHNRYSRSGFYDDLRKEIEMMHGLHKSKEKKSPEYVDEARKVNKNAFAPWTTELEIELKQKYESGKPIPEIATEMGRSKWAIEARLEKKNLKKAS